MGGSGTLKESVATPVGSNNLKVMANLTFTSVNLQFLIALNATRDNARAAARSCKGRRHGRKEVKTDI